MKKLMLVAALMACSSAFAQSPPALQVEKRLIGSGEQDMIWKNDAAKLENAPMVGNYGVYHAPQYMPGYPTAATIWPRIVDVRCRGTQCDGYDWTPSDGRGEYVFIRPMQVVQVVTPPPPPVIITPPPERVIKKPLRE